MIRWQLLTVCAAALVGSVALLSGATAQSAADADHLNEEVVGLYKAGKFAEAIPLAKKALATAEKALGPEHLDVAKALSNLAAVYEAQHLFLDAEQSYRRSLTVREKYLGPTHPDVAKTLRRLASLLMAQGNLDEAEPLFLRYLSILEAALGPVHRDLAVAQNQLAETYRLAGHYSKAEPLYRRSLSILESDAVSNAVDIAAILNNLAELNQETGQYSDAEPLLKRSIAIYEKELGPDDRYLATPLNNLAQAYRAQGQYNRAEPLLKRTLSILENLLKPNDPQVATSLNSLGLLYSDQGQDALAEPLFRRSLEIRERAFGPKHQLVQVSLQNLAFVYRSQGRILEAVPLLKRSIETELEMRPDQPATAMGINILAELVHALGQPSEAERLYRLSVDIFSKRSASDHLFIATVQSNIALLLLEDERLAEATDHWRSATALLKRRAERGLDGINGGASKGEAQRSSAYFEGLIKTTHRLATEGRGDAMQLASEMFETAEWGQGSEAASSLAQMAARSAVGSPKLAAVVRERQDLVAEWQEKDKLLVAAKSDSPAKRDSPGEKSLSERLTAIDIRLAAIDVQFANDFPAYAALASPKAITVFDVQANLRDDEVLLLFLDTDARFKPLPEETFIWAVTKTDVRWMRSELGTAALAQDVAALRCGLDYTAWRDSNCDKLTGQTYTEADRKAGKPLPFDPSRAHKLYKALFDEVEGLIKGKHLLVVPSGPLTQLPFQVLVTAPPVGADPKKIRWLARDHAITVLPPVSSLKALRRVGKPSAATEAMIGFGNPLLDGKQDHPQYGDYYKKQAALARTNQSCPDKPWQRIAALFGTRRNVEPVTTRGGLADLAHLRSQAPLPETARELCEVASSLNVDRKNIWVGARASETNIKRLSAATDATRLANYRIVHFATHGTLAGQLSGTTEPGLLLTPPETATEEDDGYLSAGEIAGLKFDADWVILSACNTAAGNAKGAEALGGLARAFFYAGARALLVSHWEVDSEATVKLITSAVGAMAKDKSVGRAEALRRAMIAMIDNGEPHEAHPAYWAPFVVVGEGAAVIR